jgi:hypothetical protein
MVSVTDSLRMQLLRSGMFRFVDKSTSGTDIEFMDARPTLAYRSEESHQAGQQSAAQMYLTGALSEIKTQVGRTVDQYYKFSHDAQRPALRRAGLGGRTGDPQRERQAARRFLRRIALKKKAVRPARLFL